MTDTAGDWTLAHHLVVVERVSYVDAAERAGVALSTLQKKAAREDWQGQRRSTASYEQQARRLKVLMLEKALEDGDPQKVFAWKQAEAAFPELRHKPTEDDPRTRLAIAVEVIEALVDYLSKEDRNALTGLSPHITPFAKVLEQRWAP